MITERQVNSKASDRCYHFQNRCLLYFASVAPAAATSAAADVASPAAASAAAASDVVVSAADTVADIVDMWMDC